MDEEPHLSLERMLTKSLRAYYLTLGDPNRKLIPGFASVIKPENDALSQRDSAPSVDRATGRSSLLIDSIHSMLLYDLI